MCRMHDAVTNILGTRAQGMMQRSPTLGAVQRLAIGQGAPKSLKFSLIGQSKKGVERCGVDPLSGKIGIHGPDPQP